MTIRGENPLIDPVWQGDRFLTLLGRPQGFYLIELTTFLNGIVLTSS